MQPSSSQLPPRASSSLRAAPLAFVGRALAALALLVAAACMVESETALSDPDPALVDNRLAGTWRHESGDEKVEIAVTPNKAKPGVLNVTYTTLREKEGKRQVERFQAWRAVIAGRDYLSLLRFEGDTPAPRVMLLAYRFDAAGALVISFMDSKAVAAAIKRGDLAGTAKDDPGSGAVITAPRAKLVAFIAGQDHKLLFPTEAEPLRRDAS